MVKTGTTTCVKLTRLMDNDTVIIPIEIFKAHPDTYKEYTEQEDILYHPEFLLIEYCNPQHFIYKDENGKHIKISKTKYSHYIYNDADNNFYHLESDSNIKNMFYRGELGVICDEYLKFEYDCVFKIGEKFHRDCSDYQIFKDVTASYYYFVGFGVKLVFTSKQGCLVGNVMTDAEKFKKRVDETFNSMVKQQSTLLSASRRNMKIEMGD